MKTKTLRVFDCTFVSVDNVKLVRVVASSFGQAAAVATSVASIWDDFNEFVLRDVQFMFLVSSFS